ncbi:hypothetical protein F5Y18DRAFT_409192, partial [Xylariaceae sp. FL1019]
MRRQSHTRTWYLAAFLVAKALGFMRWAWHEEHFFTIWPALSVLSPILFLFFSSNHIVSLVPSNWFKMSELRMRLSPVPFSTSLSRLSTIQLALTF